MRVQVVGVLLGIALLASGCVSGRRATPTARSSIPATLTAEAQWAATKWPAFATRALRKGPREEPRTRVYDGAYMAQVDSVATDAAHPSITLDFVTPHNAPGTDSHTWNQWRLSQRLAVASDVYVEAQDASSGSPLILSFPDFAARWKTGSIDQGQSETGADGEVWDIVLENGRVTAILTVGFP